MMNGIPPEGTMRKLVSALLVIAMTGALGLFAPATVRADDDKTTDQDRIKTAGTVLHEIMDIPDDIPQDVIDKAYCVIVYPTVLKAAFIVGVSYGRGVMTCRSGKYFRGPWSAPSMMALEGASFGLQAGGQATDFVLLVMNQGGANGILASKVKLGGDASVAAGPVGRTASAETDASMRAQILSYSRARGVFAGISLNGAVVKQDKDSTREFYNRMVSFKALLNGDVEPPPAANPFLTTLAKWAQEAAK